MSGPRAHHPGIRRRRRCRAQCVSGRLSSILDAVAQPDTTALEHLTAVERDRTNRGWHVGFVVAGVEDARRPLGPIDGRKNRQADLADETRTHEAAVGHAAAVHFETFYAELPVQGL